MPYQLLGKLYYSDAEHYTQIYKSRFESEESVKLDFFIRGKQAFFLQNAEVLRLAYDIVKIDKKVSHLSMRLPGVAKRQYSQKCLIDEIVLTNKIEGIHSSRKEIDEALDILNQQSQMKGGQQRFVGLVNKYLKLTTGEKIPFITCADIRNVYDEMFLDEVIAENPHHAPDGNIFRRDSTSVYNEAGKEIHAGVFPESKIIESMEQALAFLQNETEEKLFRLCIFHYLIEYIHPFYDGNGRLGRFILSYYLSETLEPLLSYRISETIKENITAYYKAFQHCNDPHNLGDLTPFLIMMLQMIQTALKDLQESLEQKLIRWERYEKIAATFLEGEASELRELYSYLIQAALFSEKGISTSELTEQLGSYHRWRKLMEQIPSALLHIEKKGKAKYYRMNLDTLDDLILTHALNQTT